MKKVSLTYVLTTALDSFLLWIVTYFPGPVGYRLRYPYYKRRLRSIGRGCLIDQGVIISDPSGVTIGDYVWVDKNTIILGGNGVEIGNRVHIAQNCLIQGGGGVKIGDYAGIAAGTLIYSATDTIYDGKRIGPMIPPAFRNPLLQKPVIVEKDVFVGARCVLLPGVKIGEGAVVGAGSIVLNDIPAWKVAVGSPAKPIKDRPKITAPEI